MCELLADDKIGEEEENDTCFSLLKIQNEEQTDGINNQKSSEHEKNRLTMLTTRRAHKMKKKKRKIPLSFARAFSKKKKEEEKYSVIAAPPVFMCLFFAHERYRHPFATVLTRLEEIVKNKEFTVLPEKKKYVF